MGRRTPGRRVPPRRPVRRTGGKPRTVRRTGGSFERLLNTLEQQKKETQAKTGSFRDRLEEIRRKKEEERTVVPPKRSGRPSRRNYEAIRKKKEKEALANRLGSSDFDMGAFRAKLEEIRRKKEEAKTQKGFTGR